VETEKSEIQTALEEAEVTTKKKKESSEIVFIMK
jgi:hypothetical protein